MYKYHIMQKGIAQVCTQKPEVCGQPLTYLSSSQIISSRRDYGQSFSTKIWNTRRCIIPKKTGSKVCPRTNYHKRNAFVDAYIPLNSESLGCYCTVRYLCCIFVHISCIVHGLRTCVCVPPVYPPLYLHFGLLFVFHPHNTG